MEEQTNLRRVAEDFNEFTKKAAQLARAAGKQIVLFSGGNLQVNASNSVGKPVLQAVRGLLDGDKVSVRADHEFYTPEQIAKHELTHDQFKNGVLNLKNVVDSLAKSTTQEVFDYFVDMYAALYATANDADRLTMDAIQEEMVCDAVSGMNDWAFLPGSPNGAYMDSWFQNIQGIADALREEGSGKAADMPKQNTQSQGIPSEAPTESSESPHEKQSRETLAEQLAWQNRALEGQVKAEDYRLLPVTKKELESIVGKLLKGCGSKLEMTPTPTLATCPLTWRSMCCIRASG